LIVVGGHDATADPEYYLRRGADLCVLGEGESALAEIVQAVAAGDSPLVPGTASLRHGTLRRDARRSPNRFDDIVFPNADLLKRMPFNESPDGPLPAGVSAPIAAFETSRGCPEACSFCDVSFVVGGYRAIPLHRLMEQVSAFESAGIRTLQIIDDNLLYRTLPRYGGHEGRDTILRLFKHLYDRGFAWEFFNGFQLSLFEHDGRIDEELIGALYRSGWRGDRFAGCFRSYVPIDKVTDDEISRLRKLKPLDVAISVVGAIAACAVPMLVLGFVIGNARETRTSLEETCEKAEAFRDVVRRCSRGRTAPVVLPLCSVPLPGTPDFRNFSRHIAYSPDEYPELYNIFVSVLHTDAFTPWELTRARRHMRNALNGDGAPSPSGSRIETRNA
jgi:radical SAM superfamily enzyme YgiQ (UPF0313 family)